MCVVDCNDFSKFPRTSKFVDSNSVLRLEGVSPGRCWRGGDTLDTAGGIRHAAGIPGTGKYSFLFT